MSGMIGFAIIFMQMPQSIANALLAGLFDPVHFGILMMTIVTMGSMTPPVGVAMYTVCGIMDVKIEDYVRESIPFVGAVLVLVTLLLFLPDVVLFLPRLAFGN